MLLAQAKHGFIHLFIKMSLYVIHPALGPRYKQPSKQLVGDSFVMAVLGAPCLKKIWYSIQPVQ